MEADAPKEPQFQVRIYGEKLGDYQLVSGWWEARHGEPLPETILPPLGVMVERDGEPVAALWCYESFGVGVAFLEMPVTRPGLSVGASVAALSLAVDACVLTAKAHAKRDGGDVCLFKCYTLPGIGRILPRFGFVSSGREEMQGFILRRD